ncbi:hypothetical protein KI387_024120, partial [Taxus chinensis]
GSRFLALGCIFLGKGDTGTRDVEGKVDGGRGWVTHGGNRGVVEVGGVGWAGGMSEREGSVMGSEEVIDGIG